MMNTKKVIMGSMPPNWGSTGKIKNISLSITDECNLRCTYCYFSHKTSKNVMTFGTAKKVIDDILEEHLYDNYDGVIWDFIGGEPTIEMELIDQISDYILYKMYDMRHHWLKCYRFMIGTNGLLYDSEPLQKYIEKHRGNLYVAITIDGSKEKHDKSRVKKDGSGSYDDVLRIIPLWQKQFDGVITKATFSHNDLPYLKESIISLWNIGIKAISANIVFENVWSNDDPGIFKQQLVELADYIIENDLWYDYSVRFFDPIIGTPYTDHSLRMNTCGTGRMIAINFNGDYYPCVRFMPSALNNHVFERIGGKDTKIETDRLRPFYILNTINQSKDICLDCDIPGGCTWCSGLNYDDSSRGTVFERQTHLCEMHKANVEANKYLWRQYELAKHTISPYRKNKLTSVSPYNKFLYILCDSGFPSFCEYKNHNMPDKSIMSSEVLGKTIDFCEQNNYVPIFCGCKSLPNDYYAYTIITLSEFLDPNYIGNPNYETQLLIDISDVPNQVVFKNIYNVIITYKGSQLDRLYEFINSIFESNDGLNISIEMNQLDVSERAYIKDYKHFLDNLSNLIMTWWARKRYHMVNVLTNELFANTIRSCGAGKNTYTISPEGRIYYCPGFYYKYPDEYLGDVEGGFLNAFDYHLDMNKAPLCKECQIRHCSRCVYKNKQGTGELSIPTEIQCIISHLEYDYSFRLSSILKTQSIDISRKYRTDLNRIDVFDPLYRITGSEYPNHGLNDFTKTIYDL